jgi:hypothetical protein
MENPTLLLIIKENLQIIPTRPVSKPGQPNPVKTVQTLLAAKKKDTSNKEPRGS